MNIASRHVSAPRGASLSCKGWPQEAALGMLMNNLDPEVAERPDDLVGYGGSGRAARRWPAFGAIVSSLRRLEHDDTLVVPSGKPGAIVRTHRWSPRVVAHGSRDADEKLRCLLTCDPGPEFVRHADAGCPDALDTARHSGVTIPSLSSHGGSAQ